MSELKDNLAFGFFAHRDMGEGLFGSLRDQCAQWWEQEGGNITSLESRMKDEIENPYMAAMHGWVFEEMATDRAQPKGYGPVKDGWKYDSYLLTPDWETALTDKGLVWKRLPPTKTRPERLKVEALPNGYKSAKSVILKALKAGVDIEGKSKSALVKEAKEPKPPLDKDALLLRRWMRALNEIENMLLNDRPDLGEGMLAMLDNLNNYAKKGAA